ncbi:apolipoprotein C-IV [Gymnodraco acuticeps]|uniref:Apolipoprotein C-IV n=1 Tax=Gymnodraco acuticeps TaxID=8218 RepID=A0A6P8WP98_GYMAC|nr:apolipoprotein C-IV [Gymnodraco acuticeps]
MIQLLLTRAKGKMHTKELVFGLILLMQACGPLLAKTKAPKQPNSSGILQWLTEKFRGVKATVQGYFGPFLGFLFAYYEDHIQPVTDSCFQWASRVWEKIHPTIDNYYMPEPAANPTDTGTKRKNSWQ